MGRTSNIMDQDDNVSFKVYLRTKNMEEEVRRFTMESSSCSYKQLVAQLEAMFPQLEVAVYAVSWINEEGDAVTVSSQEELDIAMEEMSGPVYRCRIVVKEERETSSLTASGSTSMKMIQERIRKIEEWQKKNKQNAKVQDADSSASLKLPPRLVQNEEWRESSWTPCSQP